MTRLPVKECKNCGGIRPSHLLKCPRCGSEELVNICQKCHGPTGKNGYCDECKQKTTDKTRNSK